LVYLWKDDETKKYVTQSVGHEFNPGTPVWLNNVPEDPTRLELIAEGGISSLDGSKYYQAHVVRLFYEPEEKRVYLAWRTLMKRAKRYFLDKSLPPPDPTVISSRRLAIIPVCEIDGKRSEIQLNRKNVGLLFVFGQDAQGRRGVKVYLLDGLNRPYGQLREGHYDEKQKIIVWERPFVLTYLNEKQKEKMAVRMWSLGYAPAPECVASLFRFMADNSDRFTSIEDAQAAILVPMAKRLKGRKKILAEKTVASLRSDMTVRKLKYRLASLARQSQFNPLYRAPEDWERFSLAVGSRSQAA